MPFFTHLALQLKVQCLSSPEFVLTDGQLSIVEHLVPRFKAAPSSQRKQLIEKAADRIERRYGTEFDRDMLTSVCSLSAKLG
jgi:hypothetical protein